MGTSSTLIHRENQSSPTDRLLVVVISSRREKKTNQTYTTDRYITGRAWRTPGGQITSPIRERARAVGEAYVRDSVGRLRLRDDREIRSATYAVGGVCSGGRGWGGLPVRGGGGVARVENAGREKQREGREGKGREGKRDLWQGRWPAASGGGEREGDAFYRWNCYGRTKARPQTRPPLADAGPVFGPNGRHR